jgi:hypothetical protein
MAARRKTRKTARSGRDGADADRAFAVVLEELSAKFDVLGEALQALRETMVAGFDRIDRRLDGILNRKAAH